MAKMKRLAKIFMALFQLRVFALPQVMGLDTEIISCYALTDLLHTALRTRSALQLKLFIMKRYMMHAEHQVFFRFKAPI